MNIYEALKTVGYARAEYFRWKHDLEYDKSKQKKSEAELLKSIERKNLNALKKWENTPEYRNLLAIYQNSKYEQDLKEIYDNLAEKAKEGDEKSVRLFIALGKEIKELNKQAVNDLKRNNKEKNNDDDLIFDI